LLALDVGLAAVALIAGWAIFRRLAGGFYLHL
jgi:hypothetical protein